MLKPSLTSPQDGLGTRDGRAKSSVSSGKRTTLGRDRKPEGDADGGGVGDRTRAADTLVLVDTMLVSAYMQCSPSRHSALVRFGQGVTSN